MSTDRTKNVRGDAAWERMQALLDARRDPGEALDCDAATRAELGRLLQRLAVLEHVRRPSLAPRIAAAALVLVLPLAMWSVLRAERPAVDAPVDPLASAEPQSTEPYVRVLDFRLVAETSSGNERLLTITTPEGVEQRRDGGPKQPYVSFFWNRGSAQP